MELSKEKLVEALERVLANPRFERVVILDAYKPSRNSQEKPFLEPYNRLNIVLEGTISLECGSGTNRGLREFPAGTVLVMKPFCLTKEVERFDYSSENLGIVCRPDYLRLLYTICPRGAEQSQEIDYYYHISDSMRQCTIDAISALCGMAEDTEVEQLFAQMLRVICTMALNDLKASRQQEVGRSYDQWCRIQDFIAERPPEQCTRRAIARHFNITETYVSMLFPRYSGMSFSAYIRKKTVDMAAMLLRTTDLTVKEIADRCGFSSHSHFTAVFRAIHHITPGAFRRLK
ncbi:MAG: helix-turn-helix transcriptional regulator [Victivallales bacterium]|nr:helix-turn-helix transcriptional regulator [Victivallales bacterium]